MNRVWSMPNKETFKINPIKNLIEKYVPAKKTDDVLWIDPFVRNSIFKDRMEYTNDLNPEFKADVHMDALDFLKKIRDNSCDGVLFDPPYSPRQITESYKGVGKRATTEDTQTSFWSKLKDEIARITKEGSAVITFGWNSNGLGKTRGFEIIEILLVAHGSAHNDTIVVVERKLASAASDNKHKKIKK